ncbi:hypothetical protein ABW20_dc0101061 [Dactylellina cionopaga]|nr:hypothetical protein ABW20_dc0101061 [Dactylellina cionopaga]
MEPNRRPARYRPASSASQHRVPPRYRRAPEGEDEVSDIGVKDVLKVLNGLAVFGIATLLFMTVMRFAFEEAKDPYRCAAITNEGRWLESPNNETDPLHQWQPRGCPMHNYTAPEIVHCIPHRRILFVGDQSIKSIYYALMRKLSTEKPNFSGRPWEQDEIITVSRTIGDSTNAVGVTVEFLWDPFLNSTRLEEELRPWNNGTVDTESYKDYNPPALFLVGTGIWFAQRNISNPLRAWRGAVDRVVSHMRWGVRPTFLGSRDSLLLAPVELPSWEKLPLETRQVLFPALAIDMDKYVHQLAVVQGIDVMRAWEVLPDGDVHLVVANRIYKYPSGRLHSFPPSGKTAGHIWRLFLAMVLCFYADKSPLFGKTHRLWAPLWFQNTLIGVGIISLISLRKPSPSITTRGLETRVWNEWKGAALAVHLASAYLGGSTEFSTFALLFVHSAEWTGQLLREKRGGERRFYYIVKTVVGINAVVVPVMYMMGSQYVSYQLPALYTFWFMVTCGTVRVFTVGNRDIGKFLVKMATSATAVMGFFIGAAMYASEPFRIIGLGLGINWDGEVVKMLVVKHIWAVYAGMTVGWVYVRMFLYTKGDVRKRSEYYASTLAAILAVSYVIAIKFGGSDSKIGGYHTYTSLARLALFGVVKLTTGVMRRRQSTFLIWLGSLEAGVWGLINHAWLARGGDVLLDLGIFGFDDNAMFLNWMFWTVVIVYFCWGLRDVAEVVTSIVLNDETSTTNEDEEVEAKKDDDVNIEEMEMNDMEADGVNIEGEDPTAFLQKEKVYSGGLADLKIRIGAIGAFMWVMNLIL